MLMFEGVTDVNVCGCDWHLMFEDVADINVSQCKRYAREWNGSIMGVKRECNSQAGVTSCKISAKKFEQFNISVKDCAPKINYQKL